MKKLRWFAIALILVIVGTILAIDLNLNGIVRSTVESEASESLKLQTTLGGANVSLFGGSLSLKDLEISSPAGFSAPQMFSLGDADVLVNYRELRRDPVRISLITLQKPKLVIEQANGKLNLQALMDQPSNAPSPQKPPADKRKPGEPIRLIIGKLQVVGCDVLIRPGIPGAAAEIPISIPSVDVENIGNSNGNQNGVAIKEVVMQVMNAIAAKAADSDKLPPEVKLLLSGNLSQIGDKLKGQVQQQVNQTLDAVKSGDPDALKNAEHGFKDLLKPKKD